jgi:hypothetical protein
MKNKSTRAAFNGRMFQYRTTGKDPSRTRNRTLYAEQSLESENITTSHFKVATRHTVVSIKYEKQVFVLLWT